MPELNDAEGQAIISRIKINEKINEVMQSSQLRKSKKYNR